MLMPGTTALVAVILLAGCSGGGDPQPAPTSTRPSPAASQLLRPEWTRAGAQPAFDPDSPDPLYNAGANPIASGRVLVVFSRQQATGYEKDTGRQLWQTDLPHRVCATSHQANGTGDVAVLMDTSNQSDTCGRISLIEAGTGTVMWTRSVPAAGEAIKAPRVDVGPSAVVLSGYCYGVTIVARTDASVVSRVPSRVTGPNCDTATSDGKTIVLSSGHTLTAYSATGARLRTWPSPSSDGGFLGEIVSAHPLIVSAFLGPRRGLIDLSRREPRRFGLDSGGFGGEPEATARVGNTLWVSYSRKEKLYGYDLIHDRLTRTIPVEPYTTLIGSTAGSLVVTVAGVSDEGVRLELVNPSPPSPPSVIGLLPRPRDEFIDVGPVGSIVVGGQIVRLWPSQGVQAFRLDSASS